MNSSERKREALAEIKRLHELGYNNEEIYHLIGGNWKTFREYMRTLGFNKYQNRNDVDTVNEVYAERYGDNKESFVLERIEYKGHVYWDITPLIIDCGSAYTRRKND